MRAVLILDPEPAARESMRSQFESRGFAVKTGGSAEEGLSLMKLPGVPFVGLVTNVTLPGVISGWDMARIVRENNPHAAVAYLSTSGHHDWAILGVPDSIIINVTASDHEIPDAFFRACDADDPLGEGEGGVLQEWQKLEDAVHHERSALYAHFQHTPSLIAILEGPDHYFAFANDAYVQLVERDVVGKTVVEAFPEVISQGYVEILDRVFTTGEEFVGHGVAFEMEVGNGIKRALLDLIYRPLRSADGAITGVFVEGTDLTASYAAQSTISTLQNELIHVARVNAMGLLASTLAHELNQPLTAISNYLSTAKMISEVRPVDPVVVNCIKEATASAMRAGMIIRRLRALTTKGPATRQEVTLEAVAREAVALASTGRFNAAIDCDFRATGPVHADPIQLQQVILNFIQNAIDAAGDEEARILISTRDSGSRVECCVRDSGPGIPADVLARVFDSFVTTRPEGMGIGLSLSKTIVESHGGSIAARNNADGGAMLCFSLPRAE